MGFPFRFNCNERQSKKKKKKYKKYLSCADIGQYKVTHGCHYTNIGQGNKSSVGHCTKALKPDPKYPDIPRISDLDPCGHAPQHAALIGIKAVWRSTEKLQGLYYIRIPGPVWNIPPFSSLIQGSNIYIKNYLTHQ